MDQRKLTGDAQRVLEAARRLAGEGGQSFVGSEHLLEAFFEVPSCPAAVLLEEAGVDRKKLKELTDHLVTSEGTATLSEELPYSPRLKSLIETASELAGRMGSAGIGTDHLLLAILKDTESVAARLLHTLGVAVRDLSMTVFASSGAGKNVAAEDILDQGQGEERSATPMLDRYSRDLTEEASEGRLEPVIGRNEEIARLMRILSRKTKNNPCLIGEPGVGKTAIVEGLAQRIVWGLVPDEMKNKRLAVLDISGMVAGSKYRGEFEERIKGVLKEVAGNRHILLFVDEVHTLVGAGSAEGTMDAANILKPALSRGEIQLIGATTVTEYRKHIEKDAALERRFQPIRVEEPTEEETLEILKGLKKGYEDFHHIRIPDETLKAAVTLSARYIQDRCLPDKAIDLIDEGASKVRLGSRLFGKGIPEEEEKLRRLISDKEKALMDGNMKKAAQIQKEQEKLKKKIETEKAGEKKAASAKAAVLTAEHVAEIVSSWTGIPVAKLAEKESKKLANLEKELHKRIIGQEEAVTAVSAAVRRGRVGLKDPARPTGSFLFLGPTGVGKTELSKALADAVFGSEKNLIRVDMSEYMEKHTVSRLIGSPPGYVGYGEGGQLSEKVRRNPYSVILFDEIEKAHPDIFNVLLQVLDEGHITDAEGRRVDFKNTCLIMTSNIGAKAIVDPKKLGFASSDTTEADYKRMKDSVMSEVNRTFRPEFLNRIDETIVFRPLSKGQIGQIAALLLKDLEKRAKDQLDITLKVGKPLLAYLAEKGHSDKFGARPLKRLIQSEIEDPLSEKILSGEVLRGQTVSLGICEESIKFTVRK